MNEVNFHLGIKAIVINSQKKILLLLTDENATNNGSYWDLPGGRVQASSTDFNATKSVIETLKREVLEETGLTIEEKSITRIDYLPTDITIPNGSERVGLIFGVYRCICHENQTIQLSNEHKDYKWVTRYEAAKLMKSRIPERVFLQKTITIGKLRLTWSIV